MIRPPGIDHGASVASPDGMHRFCSFSQPHHKLTPGPKRLTVHSCRRWEHTTILEMVIIVIIVNIDIILIGFVL
jgi:hypothetical protein